MEPTSSDAATKLEQFLAQKGIDPLAFRESMPSLWGKWKSMIEAGSSAVLDQAGKFQFNAIRRQFPRPMEVAPQVSEQDVPPPPRPKPLLRRPANPGTVKTSDTDNG